MSQLPYPLHFAAACYYSLCENYSRSMREKKNRENIERENVKFSKSTQKRHSSFLVSDNSKTRATWTAVNKYNRCK